LLLAPNPKSLLGALRHPSQACPSIPKGLCTQKNPPRPLGHRSPKSRGSAGAGQWEGVGGPCGVAPLASGSVGEWGGLPSEGLYRLVWGRGSRWPKASLGQVGLRWPVGGGPGEVAPSRPLLASGGPVRGLPGWPVGGQSVASGRPVRAWLPFSLWVPSASLASGGGGGHRWPVGEAVA